MKLVREASDSHFYVISPTGARSFEEFTAHADDMRRRQRSLWSSADFLIASTVKFGAS